MHSKTLAITCLTLLSALAAAQEFTLSSPTLSAGGTLPIEQVFNRFGCTGKNVSPALTWQHAPAGTQSFALTAFDPDAPTGSGWWHWVVVNLPATADGVTAGAGNSTGKDLPAGARQIPTDYGDAQFGGACPPVGDKTHRYIFAIHALKVKQLDLPDNATAALTSYMIHQNELGAASLTAYYRR